jgi:hypothetical protein
MLIPFYATRSQKLKMLHVKSFSHKKANFRRRSRIARVLTAALFGALIVPMGSFTFPSLLNFANANLTASTSSSSYVDVPFTCEAKFYQTGRPSAVFPTSNGSQDVRLFTYAPFSNTFTAGTKTLDYTKYYPNGFGYNTSDNFIYGINDNKVLNSKKIVRLDATGNFKDLGTYIHNDPTTGNPLQENKGDYWNKENKLIIGAFNNYATVDVTNLGTQTAQRLTITGEMLRLTGDMTIVGDTMYAMYAKQLMVVNLDTLASVVKNVTTVIPQGSTAQDLQGPDGLANQYDPTKPNYAGDGFGASYADSSGNIFFFSNVKSQMWLMTSDQLSQASPVLKPVGTGKSFITSTSLEVVPGTDGASCPNAPSPYSSVISGATADNVSSSSATFSTASFPVTVNPIGIPTTVNYCYGTTSTTSGGALLNCSLTASSPANASAAIPLTGSSAVTLNPLSISNLTAGTTYFWQAITTSEWATTYGSVNSFATLSPPVVATTPATSVLATTATLKGLVDPKNASATTSFCYGTSSSLTNCTSLSASPSSVSAAGNTVISLNAQGLTAGTTYYFKAVATSSVGTTSGSTLSFTTLAPPTVTRSVESNVTSLATQLNGSVNPQGSTTSVSFCLGTISNLSGCTVYNANESPLIASNSAFNITANIGSLQALTTYYYNITATNTNGASSTSIYSFTTQALPLNVTTQNGGLPPGTVGLTYSTSLVAAGGSQPYSWEVTTGSLPAGLNLDLSTGVISGTPTSAGNFTFTIKVTDSANVNTLKEFTLSIDGSPTATTNQADLITGTTARLNGLVNPQNLLTSVSFCYGTNANFSNCTQVAASQSPLAAGVSDTSVNASIQGLAAGTTYYVRIDASNNSGSTLGNSISFTTSAPPTVTTVAASNLSQTGTGARLNAAINPKSSQTTVSFCYSKSPTLVGCTSIDATPSSLTASSQSSAVSADISSLSTNTVYYFNTVATNNVGTTYGSTESFTTPTGTVAAPVITGITPATIGDISGASVTITGTGFSTVGAGAQVTIGGVSATVTSRSATQLVVTAPAGTVGATNVVVNNVDGQSTSTLTRLSFISSAPTNVSGTVANGQSQVTWTATSFTGPAVSNYRVQYSANGGDSWISVTRSASTTASQLVTGLINGSSYIFRVAAINSVGIGTFSSNSTEVIPETLPGQPTNLSGTAGNGQATLSWTAPADNGGRNIITYKVEYSSNGGSNWTEYQHPNSSSTSLAVTGLNNGNSYIFRVAATSSVGMGTFSSNSATVNLVAPLSLSFGSRPVDVVLGEPAGTHSVSATTSPLNTGTIVFGSVTPLICTVNASSGALTILAIGTCSITANNSGTTNYSAAPMQTQDIPVSSGSLAGLNLADLTFLTSASVIGSNSYLLNASSSDTQLTLTIPSNALPSGTLVKIYLNNNSATARGIITSSNYLLNFVVGWMKTDDGSLPIATTPLVITATNASIKKGMVGYGILNGVPAPLGTATSDGSITMYMTEDPLLVVAPTKPGSPTGVQASSGLNQSSLVSWTVPDSDGGDPITSYRATASPGGATCTVNGATATSCTVSNLQNATSYTFTVQAINQVGASNPSSPSSSITPTGAPSFTAPTTGLSGIYNNSYSLQLTATGASNGSGNVAISSYTVTSGTLPAGLNLNSSTGLISGTPTATGSSSITVRAADANSQTADASFTIAITRSTQSIGFTISPTSAASSGSGYSASITPTITNAGSGSGAFTYAVSSGGSATGCAISSESSIGTLSATSSGTCQITATKVQDDNYQQATATQSFTFFFASASTLVITSTSGVFGTDLTLTSSGGSAGGSTSYNTSTTGCSITAGVLQTTLATTCVVTAIRTADSFTAQATSVATNIVISGAPLASPTITSVSAANTTQLTVSFTISPNSNSTNAYLYSAASGGSAIQSLTNQSSGFSFSSLNPSTTYYISLLAVGSGNYANSAESARSSGTTLAVAVTPLLSMNPSSDNKYVGQLVTFTATASASDGGTLSYQWSFGGSVISAATSAQYSFTPGSVNQSGTYSVTVTNSRNGTTSTATASGALTVFGLISITTPTSGLSGTANSAFSLALIAAGGQSPLTYTLTSGTMPAGLSLSSSSGVISGTPTTAGSSAITVTAADANSQSAAASFTLQINAATQLSIPAIVPIFSEPIKTAIGFNVTVTNYDPLYTSTAMVTAGSISNSVPVGSNWLLTVTGLSSGQAATVTVETSRIGYISQSSSLTSSALIASIPIPPVPAPVVPAPVVPAPVVVTLPVISSLVFVENAERNGGKLVWVGSNIESVLFTGDASTYPAPYNYGAFTITWTGELINIVRGKTYTAKVDFRSASDGSASATISYSIEDTAEEIAAAQAVIDARAAAEKKALDEAIAATKAAAEKAAADAKAAAELIAAQARAAAEAAAALKAAQEIADAKAKAAAELKVAQEKAAEEARIAAELKVAQDKAAEDARIAAELKAAQEKAEADLKAAAEKKALADAAAAAALAAKKIVPKISLYSISSKLTLSAYDNAYLNKYISTLKSKAIVTCIGYYYTKNTTLAKAKALATTQATAVCKMIKKAKPTVITKVVLYSSTKAPKAAQGAKWVAVSYRVDSFKGK